MDAAVGNVDSNLGSQDEMEFDSNEAAYEYYKEYAKSVGFGTAKLSSRRSRASKEFIDAKFSCIRYGNKQQSDDAINPRPSPKIGCKASLHVKRRPNGKWYIHSFVKEHNHELLPAQAHFFRSHRNADPLQNDAKARRRKILTAVSKQYGAYHYTGSLENYTRNQHDRGRNLNLAEGDAQVLLELFVHMQEENPKFFYAVDLNEEHRLRNIFWVDAKGMDDYTNFCDVVSFDTTYYTNKYKVPLVLFIGVNQHIQPTVFGYALIADDTFYTFSWLMQTWCLSMGGRAPGVIITDQNNALKEAISSVFPETQHRYCLWHILDKFSRQCNYLDLWHDPRGKFNKCIYKSLTEQQFDKRWWKLLNRFNLLQDEWMKSLYEDRVLWVPTFTKDISFAGLSSASRAESLNSFFDKYINVETSLKDFVEQYKIVLEDRYEEQAKGDFDAWHEPPELKSPSPFEKQLSLVYTHEIFKKFQVEVLGAAACHLKKEKEYEGTMSYAVKEFEDTQEFMVEWNELKAEICCSCRSLEYKGYLCRHAIVVLQMSGVFCIPHKYILQRWTNAATSKCCISENFDDVQSKVRRFNDLCRRAIILGEEGSLSQESYAIALGAIKEALKQCSDANTYVNSELRSNTSVPLAVPHMEEDDHGSPRIPANPAPVTKVNRTYRASKRSDCGKEKANTDGSTNGKRKVPQESEVAGVGFQGSFHQMELPHTRPRQLPEVLLPNLHNGVPEIFHDVASSRYQHVNSANVEDGHLPG